jgi:Family of unknown function (DUF6069)
MFRMEPEMPATNPTDTTKQPALRSRAAAGRSPWRHGAAVSAAAAAAVLAGAALAESLGVTFTDRTGSAIPLAGFAPVTLILSMLGVALAAVLARRARRPRQAFARTTVTLLALSLVPVWTTGFGTASALSLTGLHLTAGAIVIAALRARLATAR